MRWSHCQACLLAVVICFGPPGKASAQSALGPTIRSPARPVVHPFSVGQSLVNPKTLSAPTLRETISQAADPIRLETYYRHRGDFNKFFQPIAHQRAGKVFEAVYAFEENTRLAGLGRPERLAITALEGNRTAPVDVLKLGADGIIRERQQLKLHLRALKAAERVLSDPRYHGMTLVTTQESLENLQRELLFEQMKAARRHLPLPRAAQEFENAIWESRFATKTLSGAPFPSLEEVLNLTREHDQQAWLRLEQQTMREAELARLSQHGPETTSKLTYVGKVTGKALFAADVAGTAYFTYQDVQRFQNEEIGGGYLALKVWMRSVQLHLTYYAIASPEPFSKGTTTVSIVVLLVADVATEWLHETVSASQQQATQHLLDSIDRDERFHTTRRLLLREMHSLAEQASPSGND